MRNWSRRRFGFKRVSLEKRAVIMKQQFVDWQTGDGLGRLTLRRPPLNIINTVMLQEICAALEAAANDKTLRALVVRAEGKMFSAGVDVADHTPDKVGEMIPLFDRACAALSAF